MADTSKRTSRALTAQSHAARRLSTDWDYTFVCVCVFADFTGRCSILLLLLLVVVVAWRSNDQERNCACGLHSTSKPATHIAYPAYLYIAVCRFAHSHYCSDSPECVCVCVCLQTYDHGSIIWATVSQLIIKLYGTVNNASVLIGYSACSMSSQRACLLTWVRSFIQKIFYFNTDL